MKLKETRLDNIKKTIYGQSYLYGHYNILKDYTNTTLPYVITGRVQHGWRRDSGTVVEYGGLNEKAKNNTYFLWNKYNLKRAKEIGLKNVIPIGAPFLYLDPPRTNNNSGNLLLFPIHTASDSRFKDPIKLYKRYLEDIKKIESNFNKIKICLYYRQFKNNDLVQLIKNEGYSVSTLGHRFNQNFLRNFIDLVSDFEYVSSNVFSTSIFYSLYMNKKTFVYGHFTGDEIEQDAEIDKQDTQNKMKKQYSELLWKNFDDKTHPKIACKELGLDFKKPPIELKRVLGFNPKKQFSYLKSKLFTLIQ